MNAQEDFQAHELNEHGRLVFKHKTNKNLFLHKAYRWKDSVLLLDESEGRHVIQSFVFSTFDLSVWTPVTKEEDEKVIYKYTEIYN